MRGVLFSVTAAEPTIAPDLSNPAQEAHFAFVRRCFDQEPFIAIVCPYKTDLVRMDDSKGEIVIMATVVRVFRGKASFGEQVEIRKPTERQNPGAIELGKLRLLMCAPNDDEIVVGTGYFPLLDPELFEHILSIVAKERQSGDSKRQKGMPPPG